MDRVFDVTCEGTSLAGAVAQADQQAAEYFGVTRGVIGTLIAREVIRPRAAKREFVSDHLPWRIDVHYVDLREPNDRPARGHNARTDGDR